MECQSGDSKKLTKVFDVSQRKRPKKKRDGYDDTNSVATDENTGVLQTSCRALSDKMSQPDISPAHTSRLEEHMSRRDNNSSPSRTQSPEDVHRSTRSRRKHRRTVKEDVSLALKAGLVSTPRSISPHQDMDFGGESIPHDQDSFIYDFLEEAIKKDKKRRRHSRRREGKHQSVASSPNERDERDHRHRHHHRHKDDIPSKDFEKSISKVSPPVGQILDQTALIETFAKICAQISGKESFNMGPSAAPPRTQSNKSLRCEASSKKEVLDVDRQPVRLNSHSRETVAVRTRSHLNCSGRVRSQEAIVIPTERSNQEKCSCYYDKDIQKCVSKVDMMKLRTRHFDEERYRDYPQLHVVPTRSCIDAYKRPPDRDYRDYERDMRIRHYDEEKRKYCEQKTSRSFDLHRDYPDDDRFRRSARSDPKEIPSRNSGARDKRYVDDMQYYDLRVRSNASSKDPRWRRNFDRFEKNSVISRDDERERCSERERDSGLSVADGDASTVSGRSNYLKVVKQQISEQREAMDKMMKLWKELMRCFKGISTQGQDKNVKESAANVRESAAEQMRLWWECMRRYETVARDVGDTDARLMEEIKKQRSEMAEMATMWQECLQRYRDISNDFNSLKQQLVTPETPPRMPTPSQGILCTEGEASTPLQSYRMPNAYQTSSVAPNVGGAGMVPGMSGISGVGSVGPPGAVQYPRGMSPQHGHGGQPGPPPPWWWNDSMRSPRRRSSPESRTSRVSRDREKDRRHRHKDRENSRYSKEKSSKPNAARSEHRHRKR